MEFFKFALRYTPWWSIPTLMICAHFSYVYWVKDERLFLALCILMALISAASIFVFILSGGPDGVLQLFLDIEANM